MVTSRISEEYNQKTFLFNVGIEQWRRKIFPTLPKGINVKLYRVNGQDNDADAQTVINFITSNLHSNPVYNRGKEDIDRIISEQLDKILISDNVRSQSDFKKVNSSPETKPYLIGGQLKDLENTELDSYIHRAKNVDERNNYGDIL